VISLYDELLEKIRADPSLTRRGGPRVDLGMMLLAEREALGELWKAAARCAASDDAAALAQLRAAVDRLRPLFGERP
jgi:hypothetical protein